jgi:hypothetical protein
LKNNEDADIEVDLEENIAMAAADHVGASQNHATAKRNALMNYFSEQGQ